MAGISTFADFKKEVLAGRVEPVYIVSLYDNYLLDEAGKLLRVTVFGSEDQRDNYFVRYGDEVKYDELLELCSDLPSLFSVKKIVVVKRAEKFGRNLSRLIAYKESPSEDTILLLGLDADYVNSNRLYKEQDVYDFCSLGDSDTSSWIREQFEKHGCSISEKEISLFRSSVLSGLAVMEQEIYKIASYAGNGGIVTGELILMSSGLERSFTPDDLMRAVVEKDAHGAIDILDHLLNKSAINEVYLLSLIMACFSDLLIIKSVRRGSYADLYKKYRLWKNRIEFAERYGGRIQLGQIRRIFELLVTADRQLKTTMIEPRTVVTALVENLLKV
jgi:DNA polymerase-3 subunit delta